SRTATPVIQIGQQFAATHQNGTPLRKPRKRGGSPMGVKLPPTLETRKIKKTIWWAVRRYLFIRSQGRMSSMEAPVVPRRFEASAPTKRKRTLALGVASPRTVM